MPVIHLIRSLLLFELKRELTIACQQLAGLLVFIALLCGKDV